MKQSVRLVLTLVLCLVLSLSGVLVGAPAAQAADTGAWTATSLTEQWVASLAIDPLTPSTLYAGTDGGGVFHSTDSGAIWTAGNTGLSNLRVCSLAINPINPATLYAGTWGGGVFRSANSGTTWNEVNTGLASLDVDALAINPLTPTTVYAGTWGGGVFRSANSGTTWNEVNTGLTNPNVQSLAINPLTPTTLYAGTDGGGVFHSTDSGAIWTAGNTGLTNTRVFSLAINPATPSTLYAGTLYYGSGGVFRSTNGGMSWTAVNTWLTEQWVASLAINPLTPTTVYAGTRGEGVFRSVDGGATWTALNTGLTELGVFALAINPLTPTTLYAGTWGGVFQYVPVPVRTLQSIAVAPNPANIQIGGTQHFVATGTYNFAPLSENLTSLVTWSANALAGLFTGTAVGSFPVTATLGAVTGSATVNVIAATMTGSITDTTKVLTLNYFNPVPVPPTAGTSVALASQYIYKMGDVIHGTVTFGSVVAGYFYTVQLKNMNGTVVDTVNGYQVAGLYTYPFQIATANVSFDGPYDVVVGDANESISLPVGLHVYIQYNLTWMTNTIDTSGNSTIQGWVTRANGQTVLSAVTVGIAYPDNTLAASYVVAAQSSGQFSLTFPVNPATQIGSYRVFIRDGYAPPTIPDNDAMIYRMLSNGPDAGSNTLVLLASWNLVSVSVPLPVASIPGFQAGYGYHNGWSVLSSASSLIRGEAYWVQVENAVTVPLPGTPSTLPVSLPYEAGWQLLGNPFDVPLLISTIANHELITVCYSYDPLSGWGVLNPATDSLQPGKGYWIDLLAPTILTLTYP